MNINQFNIIALTFFVSISTFGCDTDDDSNDTGSDGDTDSDTDGDSDSDSDTDSDTDTDTDLNCPSLSFEDCVSINECHTATGRRIDLINECIEVDEILFGCVALWTDTCSNGETISYAIEPKTGDCYTFPGNCFPDGWPEYDVPSKDPRCFIPYYELCD